MTAALAVFAAAFTGYLSRLYPAIAPRDSADLVSTAMTLGVAHPPGYPLYSVLGRAWLALFPFGNPAYRLNVLSALAGAAAVAGLFVLTRRRAGLLGGLTAAVLWALSAPLWKFSLLAESYALQAFFAVSLLLLAEGKTEDVHSRARLSGLLLGLGLVNHQSLLFLVPGLLWLWRGEARRCGVRFRCLAGVAAPWAAAGLALYGFVWIKLGALGPALAMVLRLRYGSGILFAGLSRPLSPESAVSLLSYAARGTADALTWPAALASLAGVVLAWRTERSRAVGWILVGLGGAAFILLSRFDPANWVAREVLEPAFLLPTLAAAVFAGEAVGRLTAARARAAAALALAAGALFLRAPLTSHRDDFLAYDFVRDLRRAVPPGGALLLSGDTASFGLRWLELLEPSAPPRERADAALTDGKNWLAARAGRRDLFVTGLGPQALAELELPSARMPLAPEGLVARVGARPSPFAAAPPLPRLPRAWGGEDSYVRGMALSYAFAAWESARLLEAQGIPAPETLDLTAVAADPGDYRLR